MNFRFWENRTNGKEFKIVFKSLSSAAITYKWAAKQHFVSVFLSFFLVHYKFERLSNILYINSVLSRTFRSDKLYMRLRL